MKIYIQVCTRYPLSLNVGVLGKMPLIVVEGLKNEFNHIEIGIESVNFSNSGYQYTVYYDAKIRDSR